METKQQWISCAEACQLNLIGYLANLGYQPVKVRPPDYWYLSPLRKEKTLFMKVIQKLNSWYDHGLGEGGNLINFAVQIAESSRFRRLFRLPFLPENIYFAGPKQTDYHLLNSVAFFGKTRPFFKAAPGGKSLFRTGYERPNYYPKSVGN